MSISLPFKLTQAGLAACWNAKNTGITVDITHVQIGSGNRDPDGSEVVLVTPQEVVAIAAGSRVAPGQVRMTAMFAGNAMTYDISELGLWSGAPGAPGSVLVCYWSQAAGILTAKAAGVDFVFAHDMAISDATSAGTITILSDPSVAPALAFLDVHKAELDPHPGYMRKFKAAEALPVADIGPIWHDAYASVMVWQAFTANGAAYEGYASVDVGRLVAESQPSARRGYIASGVSLSRAAYAALRGWALHNGVMVAAGAWVSGALAFKDNADGTTFAVADVRSEFVRLWDAGRGVDAGRQFGSWQAQLIQSHAHGYQKVGALTASLGGATNLGFSYLGYVPGAVTDAAGGAETRPRNVALLATFKY